MLGTSDPWPIPDDWLETTQQQMKVLAEDPRGVGGQSPSAQLEGRHRAPSRYLWNLITYLPSAIPVWAGTFSCLGDLLPSRG